MQILVENRPRTLHALNTPVGDDPVQISQRRLVFES